MSNTVHSRAYPLDGQRLSQPPAAALLSSTEHGDLQVVTALQAEIDALTAGIRIKEVDASSLPGNLGDGFFGYYLEHKDGARVLVFPAGQDPAQRLAVTRTLLNRAEATA
ncbi:hypothetical protein [Streptomyces bauhiniae]